MTTKEQDRKALERIRKIVAELGEGSYIGMAFEGCFEIAAENIENDFGCSMKQRAESAEKKAETLELDNRDLRLAVKKAKEDASKQITILQGRIETLEKEIIGIDDLNDCQKLAFEKRTELQKIVQEAANMIVARADEPESELFQQAVKGHRAASREFNRYTNLETRLCNMIRDRT